MERVIDIVSYFPTRLSSPELMYPSKPRLHLCPTPTSRRLMPSFGPVSVAPMRYLIPSQGLSARNTPAPSPDRELAA
jgi:hypothetical protein